MASFIVREEQEKRMRVCKTGKEGRKEKRKKELKKQQSR
jgi:hypothetical protein